MCRACSSCAICLLADLLCLLLQLLDLLLGVLASLGTLRLDLYSPLAIAFRTQFYHHAGAGYPTYNALAVTSKLLLPVVLALFLLAQMLLLLLLDLLGTVLVVCLLVSAPILTQYTGSTRSALWYWIPGRDWSCERTES
jgi:hypothetical protein